jgi:hypothetical protein
MVAQYTEYKNYCFQPEYNYDLSHTKLTPDRLYMLDKFSDLCLNLNGDFAECGVWQGGSAKVLLKKKLHLFDTFEGMPDNDDPSGHPKGDFGNTSAELVKEYLNSSLAIIYEGIIPDTFPQKIQYSFVHIDVDLYQTTKDCLSYFLPRLASGGIIIFDDYGFPDYEFSSKKAVDEMIKVICLPTGQAVYFKE